MNIYYVGWIHEYNRKGKQFKLYIFVVLGFAVGIT